MRLNSKIALILVTPMLLLVAVMAWMIHSQVLARFAELEQEELLRNHERLQEAIDVELNALSRTTSDWAYFDETYAFVLGQNPHYVASLSYEALSNLQVQGILLLDLKQSVIEQSAYDPINQRRTPLAQELVDEISALIATHPLTSELKGIITVNQQAFEMAASPITDSHKKLAPIGTLVMIKQLSNNAVSSLGAQIKLKLNVYPLPDETNPPIVAVAQTALSQQKVWLRRDNDEQISAYSLLDDLSGRPSLLLQVSMPRDTYRAGQETVSQLIGFTFMALLMFVIGTFLAIHRVAIKRLQRMSSRLLRIGGHEDDSTYRLPISGHDEISQVAGSINNMLDGLEQASEQRRHASERQRELNNLMVAMASDEAMAQGNSEALFERMQHSLAACGSVQRWSLWFHSMDKPGFDCLSSSEPAGQMEMTAEILSEAMANAAEQLDLLDWPLAANGHHCLIFPIHCAAQQGALCVEADTAEALQESEEQNFLITAANLIERSLHAHFQNLREQDLRQQAENDALTGLANRSLFEVTLRRLLDQARENGRLIGLLFIDLDRFKAVNDTYGHDVGDWLLRQVAKRLRANVRAEDLVARLGGDEFTVVLSNLDTQQSAERISENIVQALCSPFEFESIRLDIGASIGLACFPQHGQEISALVKAADLAMYQAKQRGRGNWVVATSI